MICVFTGNHLPRIEEDGEEANEDSSSSEGQQPNMASFIPPSTQTTQEDEERGEEEDSKPLTGDKESTQALPPLSSSLEAVEVLTDDDEERDVLPPQRCYHAAPDLPPLSCSSSTAEAMMLTDDGELGEEDEGIASSVCTDRMTSQTLSGDDEGVDSSSECCTMTMIMADPSLQSSATE